MKTFRYSISIYIIIPIIFSGISVFSGVISFRIAQFCTKKGGVCPIFITIGAIAIVAFLCGLVIVKFLLKPVENFIIETTKRIPLSKSYNDKEKKGDELNKFTRIFDQVTAVLSKVDARQFFPEIIGESRAIRLVLAQIMKAAPTDSTVLILGESGTGKEIVATSIYNNSLRKDKSFVKLNCVAIPSELLESELFGYEKGAFTGANSKKIGKFETANEGTIFLDEIGDMPLNLQAKILRVLQEKEFDRIGGTKSIKVNVRIIAATNKNLEKMVKEHSFREDLYYRLNVIALTLPPLRERKEDIPLLVDKFIKDAPKDNIHITPLAMQTLMAYHWPGNIRELKNVIERTSVMCEKDKIEASSLPIEITKGFSDNVSDYSEKFSSSLDEQLKAIEKSLIIDALKKTYGIQAKASELLGINQRSLWHRLKKYDIDAAKFKMKNN
ncbi:MAG: sigma-54-dependent Fis family transcriptional regulator [Desulfobacterales bacterium]|nr:sigma-54-dependent Fis family transcriptional regulator [Desulfobacterales bacterium]